MDKHIALNTGEKVNCAAFSPDGQILVCGTLNSKVKEFLYINNYSLDLIEVLLIDFESFEVLQEVCIPPKDEVSNDDAEEILHVIKMFILLFD